MRRKKKSRLAAAEFLAVLIVTAVVFTKGLSAALAWRGYFIGNYSQDITVVRSEHSGLATNSIDYLGACVFDSKPVAGFGAFVHLAKAAT